MNVSKLLLLIAFAAVANLSLAAGKIAIFDSQAAILGSAEAKARMGKLHKDPEFASMKAKFDGLRDELQSMDKEAQTDGMTWSKDKAAAHRKKMEYKNADLQLLLKKLQAEENEVMRVVVRDLTPDIKSAIEQVVKSEGIDVLLHSKVVLHAKPDLDITSKVTAKLDTVRSKKK